MMSPVQQRLEGRHDSVSKLSLTLNTSTLILNSILLVFCPIRAVTVMLLDNLGRVGVQIITYVRERKYVIGQERYDVDELVQYSLLSIVAAAVSTGVVSVLIVSTDSLVRGLGIDGCSILTVARYTVIRVVLFGLVIATSAASLLHDTVVALLGEPASLTAWGLWSKLWVAVLMEGAVRLSFSVIVAIAYNFLLGFSPLTYTALCLAGNLLVLLLWGFLAVSLSRSSYGILQRLPRSRITAIY